ncbi:deoxyribose-phosphate aldolase [Christensenella tenuis]|uniref:Deoxyribose-phosphate aldolase n=1 Tax=Christensenella tenuis TaxID=2763033 RepID=A0ABR7EFU1_9FIRM|nr:deoxyribose-phosphate aldolase [Christensenella tenuis]MBC5648630.1 deoxyribose-phosphate aldolase [Christensenella tenuis]
MEKKKITVQEIADALDHSLLRPDITVKELKEGCDLAKQYKCVSVCVRPSDLPIVIEELKGTDVLPTTVIGFPHGTCTTETKVFETKDAVEKGAVEVDMVMNIGRFLSGEYDYVLDEIKQVAKAAHDGGALLKVIFENYYLTDEQIIKASELAKEGGADFSKTSTGYAGGGATIHDLKIMVEHADGMKVKAAGGVKTLDAALAVLATGTVRIGTRSSKDILEEAVKREEKGELFLSDEGELGTGY